jgi:hypothetical protein
LRAKLGLVVIPHFLAPKYKSISDVSPTPSRYTGYSPDDTIMVDQVHIESSSDMTTPVMNKQFLEIDDLLAAIRTQELLTY